MSLDKKERLIWLGIGATAATVFGMIVLIFCLSIREHQPLSYDVEPFTNHPYEEELC